MSDVFNQIKSIVPAGCGMILRGSILEIEFPQKTTEQQMLEYSTNVIAIKEVISYSKKNELVSVFKLKKKPISGTSLLST